MDIKKVQEELKRKGYKLDSEEICIQKNNVECKGLRIIKDGMVHPIVYYSDKEKLNTYVARIIEVIENELPVIEWNYLLRPEYIKENAFFTLERDGNCDKDALTKKFENLRIIARIRVDGENFGENACMTMKVTRTFLVNAGIDEFEFWGWAEDNVNKHTTIQSLEALLFDILDDSDDMMDLNLESLFYVASSGMHGGAAAMMNTDALYHFCCTRGVQSCWILPSSIEEVILIEENDINNYNPSQLCELVQEANNTVVEPRLQLQAAVYRYDCETNRVTLITKKY